MCQEDGGGFGPIMTPVPEEQQQQHQQRTAVASPKHDKRVGGFQMDILLKEDILSTFAIQYD